MMAMRMFLSWGVLGLLLFLIESDSVLIDGMPSSSSSSSPVAAAAAAAANPSVIARRHMIAVRPASRNMYGFANQNCPSSDLALLEFRSLIIATALTDAAAAAAATSTKLEFVPVDTGGVLFWVEGVADSTESATAILARATSQAILMHACYLMMEVCTTTNSSSQRATSSSKDKDDNGDNGGNDNGNGNDLYLDTSVAALASAAGCEFSIATTQVVDMRNPNLSRQERLDILEAAGASEDAENSSTIPHTRSMPITQKDIISTTPTTVLLRRDDGKVHVGWRTAIGPAAGTGAPGKAPRRNYKGVLGTFALKNRLNLATTTTTTTTAMEPEIAFLMASLGNIQANSRVLDPCCGSASLLLCAAARGATALVGVDQNATAFTGATSEFARHGLPVPELVQGDVLAPQSTPALDTPPQLYDAILCDPPYNIGAPVLVHGQDARPASYHRDRDRGDDTTGDKGNDLTTNRDGPNNAEIPKVVDLTAAILGIAQTTLKVGGRLVFFLPVRGNDAKLPLVEVLRMHGYHVPEYNDDAQISNRLRISHGRLQRFSPTFSRWLVTMEVI